MLQNEKITNKIFMSYMCKWHFKASWTAVTLLHTYTDLFVVFHLVTYRKIPFVEDPIKKLLSLLCSKKFYCQYRLDNGTRKNSNICSLPSSTYIYNVVLRHVFPTFLFIWWNDFLLMIMEKVVKALLLHYSNEKDARRNCFLIVAWSA